MTQPQSGRKGGDIYVSICLLSLSQINRTYNVLVVYNILKKIGKRIAVGTFIFCLHIMEKNRKYTFILYKQNEI